MIFIVRISFSNYIIFANRPMKLFAFILSCYILFLTALPCIDKPEDTTMDDSGLSKLPADNHSNDSDHCSPFCSCSCCVTPVIYQVYSIELECFFQVEAHYFEFEPIAVLSPTSNIWQPPKLS